MNACEEYEELLGEALTGALSDNAQKHLHDHLDQCEACARELKSLKLTLAAIPADAIAIPENLRPAIENQIRADKARRSRLRVLSGIAAAASLTVLAGIGYIAMKDNPAQETGVFVAQANPGLPAAYTSLIDAGEYPKAFVWLQNAIADSPEHYDTAENHARLASLAYDQLQWYPQAYETYQAYRTAHPEAFSASEDAVQRFAILDEAHALDTDFASLHEWDRVQHEREITEYAGYIERYPGTLFATDAVIHIAQLVAEETSAESDFQSNAETALARLENPVVVAQFKLELGRHYLYENTNSEEARRLLQDVESSSVTVLAQAARQSLNELRDN